MDLFLESGCMLALLSARKGAPSETLPALLIDLLDMNKFWAVTAFLQKTFLRNPASQPVLYRYRRYVKQ